MYTIKQASLRSGVGIPLLRAWERRYGVVQPVRTPAGYRLYDEAAIDRLRAMRRLVEAGWSPREAAPRVMGADAGDLQELQPTGSGTSTAETTRLTKAIVQAAGAMDQDALEAALDAAFGSARFEPAVEEVVFPALAEVGSAWESGELDVGAEHAASAAVLRRLGTAYQAAGQPSEGPITVVGLPPGAHHELAALAFATAARRDGLRVVYLGPDVPVESWMASVQQTSAAAVVLGAVMQRDADAASRVFRELADQAPSVLRCVGGASAAAVAGDGHLVLQPGISQSVAMLREAISPRRRRASR